MTITSLHADMKALVHWATIPELFRSAPVTSVPNTSLKSMSIANARWYFIHIGNACGFSSGNSNYGAAILFANVSKQSDLQVYFHASLEVSASQPSQEVWHSIRWGVSQRFGFLFEGSDSQCSTSAAGPLQLLPCLGHLLFCARWAVHTARK